MARRVKFAFVVVVVVVLGFGSVTEATRNKLLRLKQHIAVQHELTGKSQLYTMCKDVFTTSSCQECVNKDAGWWAFGSKQPQVCLVGQRRTLRRKAIGKNQRLAYRYDSMQKVATRKKPSKEKKQTRYATAQSLGIPYLMYEQMLKTIQAYLAKHGGGAGYQFLAKPLTKDSWDDRRDGGRTKLVIEELKKFILAYPNAIIYREIALGVDSTTKHLTHKPMDNKKISGILMDLIRCTKAQVMEKPTMKKIESFLGGNPVKRRIAFRLVNKHVVVLLYVKHWLNQNVLYLADGNGAANDGELVPFKNGIFTYDERNYFYHEIFNDWVKGGYKNDAEKDFEGFQVIKVSRDHCPSHDEHSQ